MGTEIFYNKKILITGGAGSLGRVILKEVLKYSPEVVRVLDSSENSLFELQEELRGVENVRFFLGDIRDKSRVSRAVKGVDILFHTASLKHVLTCEYNPFEAINTNVLGTQNIIEASIDNAVRKVIFTSSDKAVNPTNTMGASKLLAEKLIISANYYRGRPDISFSCVRFGNVMNTSGSVIPLFKQQISEGMPVTITDNEMTRFVMSVSDALQLIFRAVEVSKGGEVFVPKMRALNIRDLAEVMIEELAPRYGFKNDIRIENIGIKAGEKIYEELMTEEEALRSLETDDMYIILPNIKELLSKDYSAYSNLKAPLENNFKSRDAPLLSKEGIKELLYQGDLL